MSVRSAAAALPHQEEPTRRAPGPSLAHGVVGSRPVAFGLVDIEAANGRAQLWAERGLVVIRHRGKANLPLTIKVPLSNFRGVTVDVSVAQSGALASVSVILAHADPALEVPLYVCDHDDDLVAEWRRWARDLGLPLLMRTSEGDVDAHPRMGALVLGKASPRRARKAFLKRRPRMTRRQFVAKTATVFAAEREIFGTDF